jgi:zinc/manganese transport system permease protein
MSTNVTPTSATGPGAPHLSWNLATDVHQLLAYHFMVNALRAGTIVALSAGAIGWFMVLRRQSFAGHTLAVVSFPGAAAAILLGISASIGYFGAAIAAALVIAMVPGGGTRRGVAQESAVIGTVQAFALACGVLFVSLYGGFLDSLTGLLFGTFLGISDHQVQTLLVATVVALLALTVMARPLFFATVDPDVARARGVPVRAVSVAFLVLLGCAAAEASQITGALLVFALLVMPAATAQRLTARPALSFALTLVLAVAIVWLGIAAAYYSTYPIGFTITSFGFAAYALSAVRSQLATRPRVHVRAA